MVLHIFQAYELYHGKPFSPPVEIIKKVIRVIIDVSPEAMRMRLKMKDSKNNDMVIDRVVEKIYYMAQKKLEANGGIRYIS